MLYSYALRRDRPGLIAGAKLFVILCPSRSPRGMFRYTTEHAAKRCDGSHNPQACEATFRNTRDQTLFSIVSAIAYIR